MITADIAVLPADVSSRNVLLEEVLTGLHSSPKRVPPTWFYDDRGAELFEKICELPEYYLTRTELAIMREHAADMTTAMGEHAALIEFGSGSGVKTRLLLDRMVSPAWYVPVDISRAQLMDAAGQMARDYPDLQVRPVCADFTQTIALPKFVRRAARRVVYFPGSTIGNFETDHAVALLQRMSKLVGRGGAILIGVDLKKDRTIVERAYNDGKGVTAAFNLNLLRHLNRSLNAHFDLGAFTHRAVWNEAHSRIEMHLISRRAQVVTVGHSLVRFEQGEALVTEYSHKYTLEAFELLAKRADLRVTKTWTDNQDWFSVLNLEAIT